MEKQINPEDSYSTRRKLFKNIWDTAMKLDNTDFMNKPKVIRTLRLEDVDKSTGRKKKQRIKNLRTVCRKILDFCDRQDAEDLYYNKVALYGIPNEDLEPKVSPRRKIKKLHAQIASKPIKLTQIPTLEAPQIVAPIHVQNKPIQSKPEPKIIPIKSPSKVVKKVRKRKKKIAVTPDYLIAAKTHLEKERTGEPNKVVKKTKVLRRKKHKTA